VTRGATADFIAADLGASGGRVLLGRLDGARFHLEELHRFPNGPVCVLDHLHWDALRLWSEILEGLGRYARGVRGTLQGVGVDTWGVDFALLDRAGRLLGNPYHYRDGRTNGMMARAFERVPRARLYEVTGIQFMQINTLYQLLSMVETGDPQLEAAHTLLMMPDLLHYWLSGERVSEYTIASTSQMLDARARGWATELLGALEIPTHLLPPLVQPGTVLGELRPDVKEETGLRGRVPVIAPGGHDTASAVAAIPDLAGGAFISSGTWSLMGVEVPEPVLSEKALACDVTNEGGVGGTVRLLKNVAGLWLLQESRRQWAREGREYAWEELLALARGAAPFRSFVDPGAETFLSPGDMPGAIRAFCRRTGQLEPHEVGAVVRCCLESLALKYRAVLETLESLIGQPLETIHIVGGGSRNGLLCQFTADACNRPVRAGPAEATALGNLTLQAVARGFLPDLSAGREVVGRSGARQLFEPKGEAGWEEAYARFQGLLQSGVR